MKKMNYQIIIEALYVCAFVFMSAVLICTIFIAILMHKRDKAFEKTRKDCKGCVKGINTSGLKEGDVYLSSTGELFQPKNK